MGKLWKDYGISEWIMCRSPECLVFMAHYTSNILYIGFNIFERPFSIEKTPVPQYPFYVGIKLTQNSENVQTILVLTDGHTNLFVI